MKRGLRALSAVLLIAALAVQTAGAYDYREDTLSTQGLPELEL